MTLKVWNQNFGPTTVMPDPAVDATWSGANGWARIPEQDEMTANTLTWRILAKTGAELSSSGFANYLAFDAMGVKAQAYSNTLNVEIINQL